MTVKAVLFDGYGTLFAGGMERLYEVCQTICDDHGLDLDGRGFLDAWDGHFFSIVRGDTFVTFRQAHADSLRTVFGLMGIASGTDAYVGRIFDLLGDVSLYGDVKPTLALLDGFPHGVVSNADSDHLHAALSGNDLSFELVVSSEDAEAYKPNPAIFDTALARLAVAPEETLYVGDSQEDDIVAANRGGLQMAWLNREGEARKPGVPAPEYEISTLREVLEILGKS